MDETGAEVVERYLRTSDQGGPTNARDGEYLEYWFRRLRPAACGMRRHPGVSAGLRAWALYAPRSPRTRRSRRVSAERATLHQRTSHSWNHETLEELMVLSENPDLARPAVRTIAKRWLLARGQRSRYLPAPRPSSPLSAAQALRARYRLDGEREKSPEWSFMWEERDAFMAKVDTVSEGFVGPDATVDPAPVLVREAAAAAIDAALFGIDEFDMNVGPEVRQLLDDGEDEEEDA
jgi:hypothetical protein